MLTDAVLVDRVIAGFDGAFDELYRRHANAAWRLGQSVTGNSHDAADAVSEAFARVLQAVRAGRLEDGNSFRSYLLTATRNAALDGMRRSGKSRPTDDDQLDLVASPFSGPADTLTGVADAVLVAEAFRNLPERWRSVLWLTEVEGVATKDAAEQLGLTANGAAQLAVRARAGLRERFLQAHLRTEAAPACRFTVDRLGAYVGGGLSPRDLAKVDQHLAGCEPCKARKDELEDVGSTLRRIVLPLPLGLAALSADRVRVALTSSSSAAAPGFAARTAQLVKEPTPTMRKLVGSGAASVFGIAVLSLGIVGGPSEALADLAAPPAPDRHLSRRSATALHAARPVETARGDEPAGGPGGAPNGAPTDGPAAPATADDSGGPLPGPLGDLLRPLTGGGNGAPVAEAEVGVNIGTTAGISVSVGAEPEIALTLAEDPVVGEPVDTPDTTGVAISVGGAVVPPTTVTLP